MGIKPSVHQPMILLVSLNNCNHSFHWTKSTSFKALQCFDDFSLLAILVVGLDTQNTEIPLAVLNFLEIMIQAAKQDQLTNSLLYWSNNFLGTFLVCISWVRSSLFIHSTCIKPFGFSSRRKFCLISMWQVRKFYLISMRQVRLSRPIISQLHCPHILAISPGVACSQVCNTKTLHLALSTPLGTVQPQLWIEQLSTSSCYIISL